MALTGPQVDELQQALLAAFNEDELRQLVRTYLGRNLDELVPAGSLAARVFSLIQWAERKDLTPELIDAARQANPTNHRLQAYVADHLPALLPADPALRL